MGDYLRDRKGDLKAAILWYTEAIKKSPLDPEYCEKRGALHLRMQNWADAEQDFRKVLEIDSNNEKGLINLMDTLFLSKQFEKAVSVIRTMDDNSILKMGRHYFIDEQNYEAALYLYNEAIERNPTNASNYHVRSECFQKLGEFKKAVTDLQQIVDKDPENRAYSKKLVELLLNCGRLEEASKYMGPLYLEDVYAMGVGFKNKAEYEKAVVCLNGAIRKDSDDTNIKSYRERLFCYEKLKQWEEAIADARKVYELARYRDPNDAFHVCNLLVTAEKFDEAKVALKNFEKDYPQFTRWAVDQLRDEIRDAEQLKDSQQDLEE